MDIPEWLDFFLQGNLLSESQKCFIREVYTMISNGMRQLMCLVTEAPKRGQSLILPKLETIKRDVISFKRANTDFRESFKKWKAIRVENIELLTEIADILNTDRFNCNVSRLVGSSVSIAGGAVAIGGAIASFFSFGAALPLAIMGASMIGLGSATTVGTTITELVRLKANLKRAQEKLLEEKSKHESIVSVFERYQDLIKNFEHFMESTKESVLEELQKSVKVAMENTFNALVFVKAISRIVGQFNFPIPYVQIAEIVCAMILAVYLCSESENSLALDLATLTSKILLGAGVFVTELVEAGANASVISVGSIAVAKTAARKALAQGALVSVGIILDTITLVQTSIDVHKGSVNPEAEKVRNQALYLRTEMESIERFYSEL